MNDQELCYYFISKLVRLKIYKFSNNKFIWSRINNIITTPDNNEYVIEHTGIYIIGIKDDGKELCSIPIYEADGNIDNLVDWLNDNYSIEQLKEEYTLLCSHLALLIQ